MPRRTRNPSTIPREPTPEIRGKAVGVFAQGSNRQLHRGWRPPLADPCALKAKVVQGNRGPLCGGQSALSDVPFLAWSRNYRKINVEADRSVPLRNQRCGRPLPSIMMSAARASWFDRSHACSIHFLDDLNLSADWPIDTNAQGQFFESIVDRPGMCRSLQASPASNPSESGSEPASQIGSPSPEHPGIKFIKGFTWRASPGGGAPSGGREERWPRGYPRGVTPADNRRKGAPASADRHGSRSKPAHQALHLRGPIRRAASPGAN